MNKMIFNLLIISLMFLMTSGCSEDDDAGTSVSVEQIAVGVIDQIQLDFADTDFLFIYGRVLGEPLPDFNYFKVNNSVYDTEDNYRYIYGYLDFEITDDQADLLQMTWIDTLEISTNRGSVSGTISMPSLLESVMVNGATSDYNYQIEKGDEVNLSWTYGIIKPDYVYISYWYQCYSDTEDYNAVIYEKVVPNTENSIQLFQADGTNIDGQIYVNLSSFNGPVIGSNSAGNMTGTGSGFLYRRLLAQSGIFGIDVGTGLKKKSMRDSELIELGIQSFKEYILGQIHE